MHTIVRLCRRARNVHKRGVEATPVELADRVGVDGERVAHLRHILVTQAGDVAHLSQAHGRGLVHHRRGDGVDVAVHGATAVPRLELLARDATVGVDVRVGKTLGSGYARQLRRRHAHALC